uniref:E3 ubiquitin-protein ligase MARCHF5 n=1 Tax=Phallusia mammillata TaxID=59560 RepID=A0A6F9DKY7_9ASCI|nr:E3 ubiquitin-protein ligase MARCH5 [Phallusia mammillata]
MDESDALNHEVDNNYLSPVEEVSDSVEDDSDAVEIVVSDEDGSSQNDLNDSENPDLHKNCWVCFGGEQDDVGAEWIRPCRCRGTTKWVHHTCLMRWVDEKQKGHAYTKVSCPQCNTEYVIIFPPFGRICGVMMTVDRLIYKASPIVATGVLLGSVYWTAVTYGAITVMQVLGHKEGLDMMERADPLFLLIGLPAIPVVLVLGKMIQWDEYLLKMWRRHSHKLPILNYIFPEVEPGTIRPVPQETPAREIKFTRVFCGAMFFPTVATIVGKFMFRKVDGNLQRSILGGIAFVAIKGVLKIYLKQQVYTRLGRRRINNFNGDDGTPT